MEAQAISTKNPRNGISWICFWMLTHFCVKRVSGLWAWFLLKVELWVIVLCIWLRWRNRVHVADLYIVGTRLLWWRVWWLVDWLTNNFHLPLAVGLSFFDSQQEESVHLSPHGYGSWGRKHVWTPNWPLFLNCSYNMFQIRIRLFYKTKIGSKSFFFSEVRPQIIRYPYAILVAT